MEDSMRIAVIGANGHTGRIVVKDALARGHQVVAVARTDQASRPDDHNLTNARADVRDAGALMHALVGTDAVISALGCRGVARRHGCVLDRRQQHARRNEVKRSRQARGHLGRSRRTKRRATDPATPYRSAAPATHLRLLRRHAAHGSDSRRGDRGRLDLAAPAPPRQQTTQRHVPNRPAPAPKRARHHLRRPGYCPARFA